MFSVVKPLRVKAVALETAIAYVMMTFCSSLAINLAVNNPNTGKLMMDIYNTLSDGLKKEVEFAANAIQFGATVAYNWEVETFKNIANEVRSWFDDHPAPVYDFGQVLTYNDDGFIGFTQDTYFQMYFPANADRCYFFLPNSTLFVFDTLDSNSLVMYNALKDYKGGYLPDKLDGAILKSNSGLAAIWFLGESSTFSPRDKFIYPVCTDRQSGYYHFECPEFPTCDFDSGAMHYYDYNSGQLFHFKSAGNGYAFISESDGSYYGNISFSDVKTGIDWFLDSCGLCTDTYSDNSYSYVKPESTEDVYNYDSTKTDAAQDYIDNLAGDTVSTVLPGTDEQAQTLVDNPSAVWDVSTVDYDGSINLPSVDSSMWFDKFPFCIPFDFIKLFSSFTAEPEAPKFHILVLPANSFGLSNEDIYWDIDFSDYDVLVKILRLFVGLGFLYFLMIKTRGLIGAGGGG